MPININSWIPLFSVNSSSLFCTSCLWDYGSVLLSEHGHFLQKAPCSLPFHASSSPLHRAILNNAKMKSQVRHAEKFLCIFRWIISFRGLRTVSQLVKITEPSMR
jgi:hypothetical protein